MDLVIAKTDADIAECYPVMQELRPHISVEEFGPLVRRLQSQTGFQLAFLRNNGEIKSVAGFRVSEWLAGGRYLEIEDLVSTASERSKGYGGLLFDWLREQAIKVGCDQLRLVSNVSRDDAHRFYTRKGMTLDAHFFCANLNAGPPNKPLEPTR